MPERHDLDERTEWILFRIFEGQMFWAAALGEELTRTIWKSEERIMAQVDQEGQDIISAINDAGTELDNLEVQIAALEATVAADTQASTDLSAVKDAATALRAKLTAIGSAAGGPGTTDPGTGDTGTGDGTGTTAPGDGTTAPGDGTVTA